MYYAHFSFFLVFYKPWLYFILINYFFKEVFVSILYICETLKL